MTIIISIVKKSVVKCKNLIFKVEAEMHVGGRAAWEWGLISLLSPSATLLSDSTTRWGQKALGKQYREDGAI